MRNEPPVDHGGRTGQTFAAIADAVEAMSAEVASTEPVMALSAAARLERASRDLAEHAVAAAIAAGMSWRDIGAAFGVSKQAAHQRFARHVRRLGRTSREHA